MNALVGVVLDATPPVTTLDTVAAATLLSLFLPLVVSAVTKRTASDGLRAAVNFVGVGVLAVIAIWMAPDHAPVTWQLCANTFIGALVASFAAYKGLWKPTGVTGSIAANTANFGLGSPPSVETDDKGAENDIQIDKE